jgi:hypothetical protein
MNKKVDKKPTLTERMDKLESKLSLVLDKFLAEPDKPEEPPKKEPDRDGEGNIIKYFMFVSPNTELLQMTSKRGYRKPMGPHGDYILEPPEVCSFGRDTDGPPGFFKTPDEDKAQRLRDVLHELTLKKLPHVFTEVTGDEAFADF